MPQGKVAETALTLVEVVGGQASGFGEQVIEPAVAILGPAERQAQLKALAARNPSITPDALRWDSECVGV
jgi:hypothetical protein